MAGSKSPFLYFLLLAFAKFHCFTILARVAVSLLKDWFLTKSTRRNNQTGCGLELGLEMGSDTDDLLAWLVEFLQ